MIVELLSSDDKMRNEYPIVFNIGERFPPERWVIDMAVRDSLARYKMIVERVMYNSKVNIFLDVDEDDTLNGFTIELICSRYKGIRLEFSNIDESFIYKEYFSSNLDLMYYGRYKYLGSAVWAGTFNKIIKDNYRLGWKWQVGGAYTGVSLCSELGLCKQCEEEVEL